MKKTDKKKPTVKKNPKGREITKVLEFKLTDQEKALRALEAAEMNSTIAELTIEKKIATDEFAGRIKDKTARRNVLLKQIQNGVEMRDTKCTEVKNFETQKVEFWYEGAKHTEREMTDHDRQMEIDVSPKKVGKTSSKTHTETSAKTELTAKERDIAEAHADETSAKKSWSMVNGARQ